MKMNFRIFALTTVIPLMAMRFPQELKCLSSQAYLDCGIISWKSEVAFATKTYQAAPKSENLVRLALTAEGLVISTITDL